MRVMEEDKNRRWMEERINEYMNVCPLISLFAGKWKWELSI